MLTGTKRRTVLKTGLVSAIAVASPQLLAQEQVNQDGGSDADGTAKRSRTRQEKRPTTKPDGPTVTAFLMFEGNAEAAMKFYTGLFENSQVVRITRYGKNEAGKEGSVKHAVFSLNGQELMCIDSSVKHAFTFTPAISLYVACPDEAKIARYFEVLSQGGQVFMPLDKYEFSRKYAWLQDKFGVSWQLSAV